MCNCRKSSSDSVVAKQAMNAALNASVAAPARKRRGGSRKFSEPVLPTQLSEIDGESIAEKCQTFAYMLGLDQPVSEDVLIAAVESAPYARSLMQSLNNPARLNDLLNNPPRANSTATSFSNADLLSRAGSALLRWAASGFPTVSKSVLQKREDACLACPELKEPTKKLQMLSASATISNKIGTRTGNKSCAACGCVITNKIRLATEACPLASASDSTLNRWGEPIRIS